MLNFWFEVQFPLNVILFTAVYSSAIDCTTISDRSWGNTDGTKCFHTALATKTWADAITSCAGFAGQGLTWTLINPRNSEEELLLRNKALDYG